MKTNIKLIQILSLPYSGSTLLSYLLSSNNEISTIGERNKYYEKIFMSNTSGSNKCSCKKSFNKCGFWIDLKNQIMKNKNLSNTNKNFTRFQTFRFEGFDRILNKFIKCSLSVSKHGLIANALYKFQRNSMYANEILISNIIKKTNSKYFLDSSKDYKGLFYFSKNKIFKIYPIFLFRDGRAQILSSRNRGWYDNWEKGCEIWKKNMEFQLKVYKSWDGPKIKIRYEKLCKSPQTELKKLYEFIGLDESKICIKYKPSSQHIMGNYEMRFSSSSKILDKEEWKVSLSNHKLKTFDKICGTLNSSIENNQ